MNKLLYYLCIILVILTITFLLVHLGNCIDKRGACYENHIKIN